MEKLAMISFLDNSPWIARRIMKYLLSAIAISKYLFDFPNLC